MLRKIASLTALLSILLLALTSLVLYIVPAGRVAYWSNYRLLGLTKEQWGALHLNLGLLFILAVLLHTWFNWGAMMSYLKKQSRGVRLFTREFNLAFLLVVIFSVGTLTGLPPFAQIISIGQWFSDDAARVYGEPPYGHAELSSLKTFAKRMELDLKLSMHRLEKAGIRVASSEQPLKEIAVSNKISPKQLYLIISPIDERIQGSLPKEPPAGLGKRPLTELCQQYVISSERVLQVLAEHSIRARKEMNIKEIASIAGQDPHSIYELIRDGLNPQ